MFSLSKRRRKWKTKQSLVILDLCSRKTHHRFRKAPCSKCFLSPVKWKAGVFTGPLKFLRFKECFRKAPFPCRINVDSRLNCRNKAAFLREGVDKSIFSKCGPPHYILVPRCRAAFGQHQERRPLAQSNTGGSRFTDFPSLCACSESSLINLIGWEYETIILRMLRKLDLLWQRSQF